MSEYYRLVPWYNSSEWQNVYKSVYSENLNKEHALNTLQVWKARMPALPSGIESTLSLLQVLVQDSKSEDNIANDQILRLAYSSAVMRFVNHMLDSAAAKGASLYQAAQHLGVPDWVIDLRHDTAHNNILPSLTLLRNASEICLQWLKDNYWDKQLEHIQDYKTGKKVTANNEENRINALIYFCSCLSICKQCKIKRVSDIPDVNMRESILTDAMDLLGNFTNLETESVGSLIGDMDSQAKDLLKGKDTVLYVNNALLGEESLFLSPDLLNFLSHNEFKQYSLSRRYVHCFEVLLTFLYANELLLEFLLALIELTQSESEEHEKKLLAALWVSEILASFKKTKQFLEKAPLDFASSPGKKKLLQQQYYHWYPNEKAKGLFLNMFKPLPVKLTDINFLQPIISTYNPYLSYFVNDLLMLVEPKIPQEVTSKISKLAKLISAPDKYNLQFSPTKIYTIADLKDDDDFEMFDVPEQEEHREPLDANTLIGIWKITSKQNWSTCPIGKVLENESML